MHDTDGQTIKKLTIRVPVETYLLLDDLARAGRRPVAGVARDLLVNRAPKFAPPLVIELSDEARQLIKICHGLASNLAQADSHAGAAGEPLARLSGPAGILFKLGSRAREIGLQTKSGQLDSESAAELLARLQAPAQALNSTLARPLNEGKTASLEVWKSVLTELQAALLDAAK